jgi:hypothetical protein
MRFSQNFSERVGDPIIAGRAVVPIVGITILKKFSEVAAAAIAKEALICFEIATDHVRDLHKRAPLEFHRGIRRLPPAIPEG